MATIPSESVNAEIDELLLSGKAQTAHEAESMWLDDHLNELLQLLIELDDAAFEQHEAIILLMSHGSRRLEDAMPYRRPSGCATTTPPKP